VACANALPQIKAETIGPIATHFSRLMPGGWYGRFPTARRIAYLGHSNT
jgi:hypothetical protein